MGRTAITLDGPGWKYCSEPGAHFEARPATLLQTLRQLWQSANSGKAVPDAKFWIPPGSDTVFTRPRQLTPGWQYDTRLVDHVIRKSKYTFNFGDTDRLATIREWQPAKLPDGTGAGPDDYWITLPEVPAADELLVGSVVDLAALSTASGIPFLDSLVDPWHAPKTPRNETFSGQKYTPYLQMFVYPEPFLPVIFSFSTLYFIFTADTVTLCRANSSLNEFVKLGAWGSKAHEYDLVPKRNSIFGQGAHALTRSLLVVPDGRYVWLWLGGGSDPIPVEVVPKGEETEFLRAAGSWQMFAQPKARLTWQLQVVGYEEADTDAYSDPATPSIFDLGSNYGLAGGPTVEPSIYANGTLFVNPASPSDLDVTITQNEVDSLNLVNLAEMDVQLRDEAGALWSSDGTHTKGNVRIHLVPDHTGDSKDYHPVTCSTIWFRFPRKLTDRAYSGITLLDTQFTRWEAEAEQPDLRQDGRPEGKRVRVYITDAAHEILKGAGLLEREGFPVVIDEDIDESGSYETRRVAAWVTGIDTEEHAVNTGTGNRILAHVIHARAVLSRADYPWPYQPIIVDPQGGGHIDHTTAVKIALDESGYDTTVAAEYFGQNDPYAGTAYSWLPGDWTANPLVPGVHRESIWAPETDETRLAWACRIGRELRGWLLYENFTGQANYHADLAVDLGLGRKYEVTATIYRSHAEAVAHGRPAAQCYRPQSRRTVKPVEANVVKLYGQDASGAQTSAVLAKDTDGYGSDTTYENFVGEPRVRTIQTKLALSQMVMEQLASVALQIYKRRGVFMTVEVGMAIWDLQLNSGVSTVPEVGHVFTLFGDGDWVCRHAQVNEDARNYRTSTLTLERVPSAGVAATGGTGLYPGRVQVV